MKAQIIASLSAGSIEKLKHAENQTNSGCERAEFDLSRAHTCSIGAHTGEFGETPMRDPMRPVAFRICRKHNPRTPTVASIRIRDPTSTSRSEGDILVQ